MTEPALALRGVGRAFGGAVVTRVLHDVDLAIAAGELTAVVGPSGSGKSTLLNVMGLLDRPTAGSVEVFGRDTGALDEDALTALRGGTIGFVFQSHHLLPALTAAENVAVPLAIAHGRLLPEHVARAEELLATLGLAGHAGVRAGRLSGGQQQRVALARALIRRPAVVLADEPTGNLDSAAADAAFERMRAMNDQLGVAFVVVTHDPRLADRCRRVIRLLDGRVVEDLRRG
ncbi:ABC transporter-related protein [Anaeromyxobacter sp. K]|uniref:ABC transporter ATP-binding protein n=1 Tax=Anaeromyxobacter sp. (strain K) TaxID=447217 RepID=UPI00015F9F69|nr:ABC transporter ATP-binding protein [Anaeromyxobacter sp. K]ACG74473.1 ABC transporter-related protein [Anaeromyxobacter sp. K]